MDNNLGFAGLLLTGRSPEVAWQAIADWASHSVVQQIIEHLKTTERVRQALEYSVSIEPTEA
ncbi:hypothetical protein ADL22_17010 [Streptomyces sp. NRRL F-4489]|uniref:hypothetical protein n=1 Tax=Streptomyces sp. NRRL F-4489 TaxID=1609095 RepID=UPI00074996CD|nr:hypothetical protein [Streptomyces sp. NRRL F-4489]KUL38938.1 hypothetical protein ADL22_17010 [Streptomyces sp. NRRL F-4489]